MPAPSEQYHPENSRHQTVIAQFTLDELRSEPVVHQSLLQTYCDVFNSPPWSEDWKKDDVDQLLGLELGGQHKATLALEGERVLGFFWGREGRTDDIVPLVIHTYLAREVDGQGREKFRTETREEIIDKITQGLKEGEYPDLMYCALEMGVLPELQGSIKSARAVRQMVGGAINEQLSNGRTEWMSTLTSRESPVYTMFSKSYRMADVIWESGQGDASEASERETPYLFLIKNMHDFFRSPVSSGGR